MHASIAGQLIAQVEDLHLKRFRFPLSEAKLLREVGHPEGKAVSLLAHFHELIRVTDPVEHTDHEEKLARCLRLVPHRCQALALAGGVSWAASAIIAKQLRAAHTVDVLALTFWQMLYGLPPLLALAWLWPGAPTAWAEPGLWLTLGFAGVFAGGIGWLMWLMLLGRLSAGAAGLNVLIIPAIAVLAAWLQLGERPSPAEFAGMALIALALSLLALLNMKPPSRGD